MKYTVFFASTALFLLCSCATTSKTRFTVNPLALNYPAGSVDAQSDKLFSGEVQKKGVTVSYYPDEDAVCLEYRVDFINYYQFWNRPGRETFISALERYKVDYEQRNLNEKSGRKESRAYGKVRGYLGWQTLGFLSELPNGPCEIDIGYSFQGRMKSKTPYLTITQSEAEYQTREGSSYKTKSAKVKLFFTRAQAEELAALFDQDYLLGLRGPKPRGSGKAEVDEY